MKYGPLLRQIISLVGRRADDQEVIQFVTEGLGKKVPASMGDAGSGKYVVEKKKGVELLFHHDIKHDLYPLLNKSKKSFIPYHQVAWVTERFAEPLPTVTDTEVVDAARAICLYAEQGELAQGRIAVSVDEARELSARCGVPALPVLGLFVAWAALRGLLDETRLEGHADLLAAVRRRERPGSALVAAAWPRGLWDCHLKDESGLRQFAHGWFHNIGGSYIIDDLVKVFGGREGPYGHTEAVLDSDNWAAVDRATLALDKRFAAWARKTR
jgi:hypothetical protein